MRHYHSVSSVLEAYHSLSCPSRFFIYRWIFPDFSDYVTYFIVANAPSELRFMHEYFPDSVDVTEEVL